VSSSGCALDSRQIHKQLHDDLDSSSEFSQDSYIDIFDCMDPDAKMSRPDLSDSCSNSDDSQASAYVGGGRGDSGGGGGGDGYDKDDNEDWAFWGENVHVFYMIPFCVSSG
jgi:hypothetical protein